MKKTLLSLVSLLPFTLLASCSSANTKLPNSGKNISAEEGRQKLANSIENTIEEDNKPLDAIGFEVNDSHSKTELTGYMKNADTSILDLNVDLTLKKGDLKAGFNGLNATDPNDIKFLLSGRILKNNIILYEVILLIIMISEIIYCAFIC